MNSEFLQWRGQSIFMMGGMVGGGVKNFFGHFFPCYKILANFFAIFIISSFQFEIFMGVPPHRKPLKNFMMGGPFKVHDGGTPPPSPPVPISGHSLSIFSPRVAQTLRKSNWCSTWFQPLAHPSFPHPTDCQKFITCYFGKDIRELGCMKGQVFDHLKGMCKAPEAGPPDW